MMRSSSDATMITADMIYYGGHSGCCIRKSLVEGLTDEAPYKGDVTVTIVRMSDYALYNEE